MTASWPFPNNDAPAMLAALDDVPLDPPGLTPEDKRVSLLKIIRWSSEALASNLDPMMVQLVKDEAEGL